MCIVIKQRDEGYIPVFQTKVKICWCLHHLSFPEEDLLVWKATASLSSDGADKISALFSISLWPGFREKWIGKPGLFGKWSDIPTLLCHPTGQSVSLRSIEQLPPLVWLINDTLITTISPHGPTEPLSVVYLWLLLLTLTVNVSQFHSQLLILSLCSTDGVECLKAHLLGRRVFLYKFVILFLSSFLSQI